jgi:DNA polymerase-3 subunit alpha
MKYRHYLIPNSFTYIKILVKEGWPNKETGKRGDPMIQFSEFKMLQDVFENYAKKLSILLDIKHLNAPFISKLNAVFQSNKGNNSVTFDIVELETVMRQAKMLTETVKLEEKTAPVLFDDEIPDEAVVFTEEFSGEDEMNMEEPVAEPETAVEETKVITRISMPSRKLKIKISNELLMELEKMDLDFRLN